MTDNVEKRVRNDMVDDLIPGAKEKRESDAMQEKLARAERSLYGTGGNYGYGHGGYGYNRQGSLYDDADDYTSTYSKPKTYKAPAVTTVAVDPAVKMKRIVAAGVTYSKELTDPRATITTVSLEKIANLMVGQIEQSFDIADLQLNEGAARKLREFMRSFILDETCVWDELRARDVGLKENGDETDDEDQFDDWHEKVNRICKATYNVEPIEDYMWSIEGMRSVWFNGSSAEWMVKHFADTERLKPVVVNKNGGGNGIAEESVQPVGLDD